MSGLEPNFLARAQDSRLEPRFLARARILGSSHDPWTESGLLARAKTRCSSQCSRLELGSSKTYWPGLVSSKKYELELGFFARARSLSSSQDSWFDARCLTRVRILGSSQYSGLELGPMRKMTRAWLEQKLQAMPKRWPPRFRECNSPVHTAMCGPSRWH